MKVLLISNYIFDQQQSMQRFSEMLYIGLSGLGHDVKIIQPIPLLGKIKPTNYGFGKWLGYIDKFFLFPKYLNKEVRWADIVHICDHSNGMYIPYLKDVPHLITCHDLLAVRGALGEDTACDASATGKIFQRLILSGLKQAKMIVCDSTHTLDDVERVVGAKSPEQNRLILLGQNFSYRQLNRREVTQQLINSLNIDSNSPYLLHVGSSHPRKNRDCILRVLHKIRDNWHGVVVFAGESLTPELVQLVNKLDLKDRVIEVVRPSNDILEALYNRAFALLFPSRAEGFGWPIIEAQACGCPVICSDQTSLPEVAGEAALICPIEDENSFAEAVISLKDELKREYLVKKGFENIKRFSTEKMCSQYAEVYQEILQNL